MKMIWKMAAAVVFTAVIPAASFAGGPQQGPMQGPAQAPGKEAPGKAVGGMQANQNLAQSNVRRAYSYDPATPAAVRTYSYQPARTNAVRSYSYNPSAANDFSGTPSYMVPKALRNGFNGR